MRGDDRDAADEVHGRAEEHAEGEEAETPGRSHATSPRELNRANLSTADSLFQQRNDNDNQQRNDNVNVVPQRNHNNCHFAGCEQGAATIDSMFPSCPGDRSEAPRRTGPVVRANGASAQDSSCGDTRAWWRRTDGRCQG